VGCLFAVFVLLSESCQEPQIVKSCEFGGARFLVPGISALKGKAELSLPFVALKLSLLCRVSSRPSFLSFQLFPTFLISTARGR
jgi:hypothetical protein